MFIWNIIGHQKITRFLESAIVNDKLVHAYLFYGPKQIGKKTLTKKFIQILMCYFDSKEKKEIPCHFCDHCQQIEKNIHPDIFWLRKESDKKDINIEQIRDLQNNLAVHSFFKSYKVAVIENAEQMNLASFNALLKTLEEPTPKTIIILITHQIGKIPKTVLSRSQKIKFLPVPSEEIYNYLVKQNVDREQAKHLSSLANGRPGRALTFLNNKQLWQEYLAQLSNLFSLINSTRVKRMKFAEKFLANKKTIIQKNELLLPILNLWQLVIRDLMLHKLNQDDKIINTTDADRIAKISERYSLLKIVNLQKNIELTKKHLKMNVNPRLALENLLLSLS